MRRIIVNEWSKSSVDVGVLGIPVFLVELLLPLFGLTAEPLAPLDEILLIIAWDIRDQEETHCFQLVNH